MGHTCTHDQIPGPNGEHPVIAVLALIAIVAAIVLIAWVRLEVHGTGDIEAALTEEVEAGDMPLLPPPSPMTQEERKVDEAVTSGRFATGGFAP